MQDTLPERIASICKATVFFVFQVLYLQRTKMIFQIISDRWDQLRDKFETTKRSMGIKNWKNKCCFEQ